MADEDYFQSQNNQNQDWDQSYGQDFDYQQEFAERGSFQSYGVDYDQDTPQIYQRDRGYDRRDDFRPRHRDDNGRRGRGGRDHFSDRRRSNSGRPRSRDRDRDRDRRSNSSNNNTRPRDRSRSRDRDDGDRRRNRDRRRSRDREAQPTEDESLLDNEGDTGMYGSTKEGSQSTSKEIDNHLQGRGNSSGGSKRINGRDWKDRLTSIREAHFNRSKKPSSVAQNQFQNDGSFMEMFKKMQQNPEGGSSSVTPNSVLMASQSIQFSPELSLPPLTPTPAADVIAASVSASHDSEDVDGVPIQSQKTLPMPVSMGKRRMAKPLKTGIVVKKAVNANEDPASQEKLDAWARYLQEVQKYKNAKCVEDDTSRPLVK